MKRFSVLIAALAVLAAGCNGDTGPDGDDNLAQFTANLLASNEVPPVANAESTASGTATIELALTRDATGTITGSTATLNVTMAGFQPASAIRAAHVHTGAVGVNGGIVIDSGIAPGQVALTNGSGSFSRSGIVVNAATTQAVVNNPAAFYFNVHSSLNPGGVIRGQLVRSN